MARAAPGRAKGPQPAVSKKTLLGFNFMNNICFKRSGMADGFTLIEALVVIGVIAILAMMTIPSLMSIVPTFQARQATEATSSLMYMARMTAANTQKPVRAVVDCRLTGDPCRLALQVATFNSSAELTGWIELPNTVREIGDGVRMSADASSEVFSGSQPANAFWAIFLPKGGLLTSSHIPMNLIVRYGARVHPSWGVAVDKTTGLVTVAGK